MNKSFPCLAAAVHRSLIRRSPRSHYHAATLLALALYAAALPQCRFASVVCRLGFAALAFSMILHFRASFLDDDDDIPASFVGVAASRRSTDVRAVAPYRCLIAGRYALPPSPQP